MEENMYDVEMMQMLNLIHAENQYIFEILRAGLLSNDVKDAITFDDYDKELKELADDYKDRIEYLPVNAAIDKFSEQLKFQIR